MRRTGRASTPLTDSGQIVMSCWYLRQSSSITRYSAVAGINRRDLLAAERRAQRGLDRRGVTPAIAAWSRSIFTSTEGVEKSMSLVTSAKAGRMLEIVVVSLLANLLQLVHVRDPAACTDKATWIEPPPIRITGGFCMKTLMPTRATAWAKLLRCHLVGGKSSVRRAASSLNSMMCRYWCPSGASAAHRGHRALDVGVAHSRYR